MASKRTNDSVDRILDSLNREQQAQGLRDRMTENEVDDILRSVGILDGISSPSAYGDTAYSAPTPNGDAYDDLDIDALLADLPSVRGMASSAPASSQAAPQSVYREQQPYRAQPPVSQPVQQPVRQAAYPAQPTQQPQQPPRRAVQPAPPVQQQAQPAQRSKPTKPEDTGTGIIKNLLERVAKENTTSDLSAGNFKDFFGNSVAVIPEEQKPSRPQLPRRGIFGLSRAEETGEYEPIMPPTESKTAEQPQNEPTSKRGGFFGNLFRRRPAEDTSAGFLIPEGRAAEEQEPESVSQMFRRIGEEEAMDTAPSSGASAVEWDNTVQRPPVKQYPRPTPSAAQQPVSKYSQPVQTYQRPQPVQPEPVAVAQPVQPVVQPQKQPVQQPKATTTRYDVPGSLSGWRETNRFMVDIEEEDESPTTENIIPAKPQTPRPTGQETSSTYRKKRDTVEYDPRPVLTDAQPDPSDLLKQEVSAPPKPVSTGFTMKFDAPVAHTDTQEFMAALAQVRPRKAPPVQQTPPVQPVRQPSVAVPSTPQTEEEEVDSIVDAIISNSREQAAIRLQQQPVAPAASNFTEKEQTDHSGTTGVIRLSVPQQKPAPQKAPAARPQPAKSNFDVSNFAENIAQNIIDIPTGVFAAQKGHAPLTQSQSQQSAAYGQQTTARSAAGTVPNATATGSAFKMELPDLKENTFGGKAKKRPSLAETIIGLKVGGKPADEQPGQNAAPFEDTTTIELPRFESAEDAPLVEQALERQSLTAGIVTIVSAVVTLALLYLGIAATGTLPMPPALDPITGKVPLLVVFLLLLLVACGASWRTMVDGLRGLTGSATADTMPALAAVGAIIQLVVFIVKPELYDANVLSITAGAAALTLCFNNVGKLMDAGTILENFHLVTAKVDHSVAYHLKDVAALNAVTAGLSEAHPAVLVSRPTQMLKNFLRASHAHRTSDKNQQQLARLLAGCAVLTLLITLVVNRDVARAVTCMAAVMAMGAPLAGTLLSALPARRMQRSAAMVGAVVPGWNDIRKLGRINVIQVTAKDLFPLGCVSLCGMKPVYRDRYDLAIAYAASMLHNSSGTLKDIFLKMLGGNGKLLAEVTDREEIYGKGCVGWIKGERVLVGNRTLMTDYGVELPSLAYEQKHTVNQRRVIYLAVSGKLFAMFQVAYQRDPDTAAVLDSLRRTGMSLIVDCDDFNCDAALLEAAYSLPAGVVKVLNGREREALAPATAWLPESEGNMLHLGSFASFVGGLEAASGAAEAERKAAMVLSASVLLSAVMAVAMIFSAGFAHISLAYILLYQAAWAVVALIFPLMQQY